MDIECFSNFCAHIFDYIVAVLVEDVHKGFKDVHVESGGNHFTVGLPFVSVTDEKAITEPWFEVLVITCLLQVNVAIKNDLKNFIPIHNIIIYLFPDNFILLMLSNYTVF